MTVARPLVAVSACLLGEKVRYDGGDKRNEIVLGPLAAQFDFFPFCPEVGVGLPVPRPPLQLMRMSEGVRVVGVDNREVDVTDALSAYAREMAAPFEDVCGVVFKCRSPSCGLASTPLHDQVGNVIGTTSGIFAAGIEAAHIGLPLTDEEALADPRQCDEFIHRVMARHHAGL